MRNGTLDHARLVAALGIVLFHCGGPGAWIGYAGLPFFTMLLVVLALPGAGRQPPAAFAAARAGRLLRPWLIWSAVYGSLKLAEALVTGRPLASEFTPAMLLTGPAIHLWFLPFAFVACLAVYPLARHWTGAAPVMRPQAALAVAALAALGAAQAGPLPVPLAQWAFVIPSVFLGMAFALARGDRGRILAAAGLAAAVVAAGGLAGWTRGLEQLALAAGALTFCLLVRRPETPLSQLAAALALGVYLGHPLVASVLERLTPLEPGTAGFAAATLAGALALAFGLHRAGQAMHRHRIAAGSQGA
jgi:hypothetical protein